MSYNSNNDDIIEDIKRYMKIGAITIAVIGSLVTVKSGMYKVSGGEYAMEVSPSGEYIPRMTPGWKWKVPLVSDVFFYNRVTTVTYGDGSTGAASDNPAKDIRFADTYEGTLRSSFRITMPSDPDQFKAVHDTYKRYDNLVENGYEKFTKELMTYTATQFTGEAYMQGGQNEYRNALKDQAENGLYITKLESQAINQVVADAGSDVKVGSIAKGTAVRKINVKQYDENGKVLRDEHTLSRYGFTIDGVTIEDFEPEKSLRDFMAKKKNRIQARAELVEAQETERQQAITEKLKGDRERIQAKQAALKEKDMATIQAEKRVELERQQAIMEIVQKNKEADLAKIEKATQLKMSQDNEGIQKANYKAARYEAQAIKEKGLAEAVVTKAKYAAINPAIMAKEVERDLGLAKYKALPKFKVELPNNLIMGGGDSLGKTPLENYSNMMLIEKMK